MAGCMRVKCRFNLVHIGSSLMSVPEWGGVWVAMFCIVIGTVEEEESTLLANFFAPLGFLVGLRCNYVKCNLGESRSVSHRKGGLEEVR